MGILRLLFCGLLILVSAYGQLPRNFYAWWSSPVVKDLNLSKDQQRQIREIIADYRPRLMLLRTEVNSAEQDLEEQFNQENIDHVKAHAAVDRLATARADLTRTLSNMSLQLRALLTQQQWQDLQRRRPNQTPEPAPAQSTK